MKHKIILGTVQFGLNYGINNSAGKTSGKEVFEILDLASKNGIINLDTADAYGSSISQIAKYHYSRGTRFKILSKFSGVKKGELKQVAEKSLISLGIDSFEVFSYHSFNDFLNKRYLADELLELKSLGRIKSTGISVYSNGELEKVIEDKNIDVVQLPYNLLDNSNLRGSLINKARAEGKVVHVRSVFLQGLFFMNFRRFPEKLTPLKAYLQKINEFCANDSLSLLSLAFSYALYNQNIDNVLIGVDNCSQLQSNLDSVIFNQKGFDYIDNNVFVKEIDLLNPVNWK